MQYFYINLPFQSVFKFGPILFFQIKTVFSQTFSLLLSLSFCLLSSILHYLTYTCLCPSNFFTKVFFESHFYGTCILEKVFGLSSYLTILPFISSNYLYFPLSNMIIYFLLVLLWFFMFYLYEIKVHCTFLFIQFSKNHFKWLADHKCTASSHIMSVWIIKPRRCYRSVNT